MTSPSHLCPPNPQPVYSRTRTPQREAHGTCKVPRIAVGIGFVVWRSAPAAAGPAGEGANQPPNLTSNRRLQQTQAQVDEVVDIMRVNVDKVLERDQKLSELDDRADALQAGASQFETSAAKLKNKYWWKNAKMMIILGVICVIVLIVIIGEDPPPPPPPLYNIRHMN
ncbi:vesicle-associated membrane protein 2-like [Brachionichthys hirsutus]|uniref:vesicle-associated membrane protein 2-like n=1 Tax=Brachionichthys hirsutus TaxID=412623 RepID=UPI003605075A